MALPSSPRAKPIGTYVITGGLYLPAKRFTFSTTTDNRCNRLFVYTFMSATNLSPPTDAPRVGFDASAYPHLLDAIASYPASWAALRATSSACRDLADRHAFAHVVVSQRQDILIRAVRRGGRGGGDLEQHLSTPDFVSGTGDGWSGVEAENSDQSTDPPCNTPNSGAVTDGDACGMRAETSSADIADVFNYDGWGDTDADAADALSTVLPLFPPRDYSSWRKQHGETTGKWTLERACARLLGFVRTLDLHGPIRDFNWGWAALSNVEVLRLRLHPSSGWMVTPTVAKVVLWPLLPDEEDDAAEQWAVRILSRHDDRVATVDFPQRLPKLVSNVRFCPHRGPFYLSIRKVRFDELVYVFSCLSSSDEVKIWGRPRRLNVPRQSDSAGSSSHRTVADRVAVPSSMISLPILRWHLFAESIAGILLGQSTVACTFVDFPDSRGGIGVDTFFELVRQELAPYQTFHRFEGTDEALGRIRLMTRSEYAATLRPGEVELETADFD